jgi:hypothetical protein
MNGSCWSGSLATILPLSGEEKVDVVKFVWPKGSTNDKGIVGGYTEFGFGARVWGAPMQGFDVYYDDVQIDTRWIGK